MTRLMSPAASAAGHPPAGGTSGHVAGPPRVLLRPGDTLGIIGGGQLARMLAVEARRAQLRVLVQDPDGHGPAAQVADGAIAAAWTDEARALELAAQCQVITVDNEHVPASLLRRLEAVTVVRPGAHVLEVIQDRLTQRQFLEAHALPQVRFLAVSQPEELAAAVDALGAPCVLKSRREGYDGKGQQLIRSRAAVEQILSKPWQGPSVLESFVDFACEASIVMARGEDGSTVFYPMAQNEHRNHTLWLTQAPAPLPAATREQGAMLAESIAHKLGHIGVLAVEYFVTREGALLINEIAPRTHNSGHHTLGACETSQFEQHLRAIGGWGLGSAHQHRPAAMLNLYGDLWQGQSAPDWDAVLCHPSARLHLYGKREARPGRKMGHIVCLGDTVEAATELARSLDARLSGAR